MQGLLNKLVGVHPAALSLQAARADILSSNMVNADTPEYKARDIDFTSMLRSQMLESDMPSMKFSHTDDAHMNIDSFPHSKLYRTPTQASLDGNTVETHIEKSHFMENSMRYQLTTQLLAGKFSGFIKALSGE